MATKKVGTLIKEARTKADLSQEKLAKMIPGLSATDIGKAERGEKELTQDQLKAIAKATGVTQKSLLEAASGTKKTTASKAASDDFKLTAAEKKLVELYRKADADTKKKVTNLLKGESTDGADLLGSLLEGALGQLMKK